eukprot:4788631-Karenia_brevis.AAC.1
MQVIRDVEGLFDLVKKQSQSVAQFRAQHTGDECTYCLCVQPVEAPPKKMRMTRKTRDQHA